MIGDPRHDSLLASKFINCLMESGKKSTAQTVFYDALDIVQKRLPDVDPIEVFTQAVENVKPAIEVRSKRVGGAAYQVPMQVNRPRQQSLAIRWILMAVRERKGRPTHEKLADELVAAYNREGVAMSRARKRASHGRRQQGVRPLRLVRSELSRGTSSARRLRDLAAT